MDNENSKTTRTLEQGLNGSGNVTWIVFSEWTDATGRTQGNLAFFDTKAEALNWMVWA